MRKIFVMLSLLVASISLNAQSVVASMPVSGNYVQYVKTTDVDSAYSTTAKTWDVYLGKDFVYGYNIIVDADTGRDVAEANFTFQVQGSDDDVNYYDVGSSKQWFCNGDTIIRFDNLDQAAYNVIWVQEISTNDDTLQYPAITRTAWRFLRVKATGSGSTAKMYLHKLTVAVFKRPDTFSW